LGATTIDAHREGSGEGGYKIEPLRQIFKKNLVNKNAIEPKIADLLRNFDPKI
jgi:hypothetical protein